MLSLSSRPDARIQKSVVSDVWTLAESEGRQKWILISRDWWRAWARYVQYEDSDSQGFVGESPCAISNANVVVLGTASASKTSTPSFSSACRVDPLPMMSQPNIATSRQPQPDVSEEEVFARLKENENILPSSVGGGTPVTIAATTTTNLSADSTLMISSTATPPPPPTTTATTTTIPTTTPTPSISISDKSSKDDDCVDCDCSSTSSSSSSSPISSDKKSSSSSSCCFSSPEPVQPVIIIDDDDDQYDQQSTIAIPGEVWSLLYKWYANHDDDDDDDDDDEYDGCGGLSCCWDNEEKDEAEAAAAAEAEAEKPKEKEEEEEDEREKVSRGREIEESELVAREVCRRAVEKIRLKKEEEEVGVGEEKVVKEEEERVTTTTNTTPTTTDTKVIVQHQQEEEQDKHTKDLVDFSMPEELPPSPSSPPCCLNVGIIWSDLTDTDKIPFVQLDISSEDITYERLTANSFRLLIFDKFRQSKNEDSSSPLFLPFNLDLDVQDWRIWSFFCGSPYMPFSSYWSSKPGGKRLRKRFSATLKTALFQQEEQQETYDFVVEVLLFGESEFGISTMDEFVQKRSNQRYGLTRAYYSRVSGRTEIGSWGISPRGKRNEKRAKIRCPEAFLSMSFALRLGGEGEEGRSERCPSVIRRLLEGKVLHPEREIVPLCEKADSLLSPLPNVVTIESPLWIVGDLHGDFSSLMKVFEIAGMPSPENKFVFLGDYVDRGMSSLRVFLLLVSLAIEFPKSVVLLRGNHEDEEVARRPGQVNAGSFWNEVCDLYVERAKLVWEKLFHHVVRNLPLACVVTDQRLFCTHGGIASNGEHSIEFINESIQRKTTRIAETPRDCLFHMLCWADPRNKKKGLGLDGLSRPKFGPDQTERFLETNKLKMIVRAHEISEEGFFFRHGKKVLTVFSSAFYCGERRKAAIVRVDESGGIEAFQFQSPLPRDLFGSPLSDEADLVVRKPLLIPSSEQSQLPKQHRLVDHLVGLELGEEEETKATVFPSFSPPLVVTISSDAEDDSVIGTDSQPTSPDSSSSSSSDQLPLPKAITAVVAAGEEEEEKKEGNSQERMSETEAGEECREMTEAEIAEAEADFLKGSPASVEFGIRTSRRGAFSERGRWLFFDEESIRVKESYM